MANIKIDDLTAATALTGTENIELGTGQKTSLNAVFAALGGGATSITDYTASTTGVLADQVVRLNSISSITYTVPSNSSVAHPIGKVIEVWQMGGGQAAIAGASGVVIRVRTGKTMNLVGQYSGVSLRKVAANEWYLVGDLEDAP